MGTTLSSLCPATQTSSSPSPLSDQLEQYVTNETKERWGRGEQERSGQYVDMSDLLASPATSILIPIISLGTKPVDLDDWVENIYLQLRSSQIYQDLPSATKQNNYGVQFILFAALQLLTPSARFISKGGRIENEPATDSSERIALDRIAEKVGSLYEKKCAATWIKKVLRKSNDKPKYHQTMKFYRNDNDNKDKMKVYQQDYQQVYRNDNDNKAKMKVYQQDYKRRGILNGKSGFQWISRIIKFMASDDIQAETDENDVGIRGYTKEEILLYCQNRQYAHADYTNEDWIRAATPASRQNGRSGMRNELTTTWQEQAIALKVKIDAIQAADSTKTSSSSSSFSNASNLNDCLSILNDALGVLPKTCIDCVSAKCLDAAITAAGSLDLDQDPTTLKTEMEVMVRCLGKHADLFVEEKDQFRRECLGEIQKLDTVIKGTCMLLLAKFYFLFCFIILRLILLLLFSSCRYCSQCNRSFSK